MPVPIAAFAIAEEEWESLSSLCATMLQKGHAQAVIRSHHGGQDYLVVLTEKGPLELITLVRG